MSEIIERVKQIRTSANMNQTEFGAALNLKQSTIASYECGARPLTDRVIVDICRTFNVDEHWLRTGDGSPELQLTEAEEIERFVSEALADKNDDTRRRFLIAFSRLDADGWKAVSTLVKQLTD